MTLLLRPRNFFTKNPALDVPPSYCSTPSSVAASKNGVVRSVLDLTDGESRLVDGKKCCA